MQNVGGKLVLFVGKSFFVVVAKKFIFKSLFVITCRQIVFCHKVAHFYNIFLSNISFIPFKWPDAIFQLRNCIIWKSVSCESVSLKILVCFWHFCSQQDNLIKIQQSLLFEIPGKYLERWKVETRVSDLALISSILCIILWYRTHWGPNKMTKIL